MYMYVSASKHYSYSHPLLLMVMNKGFGQYIALV